MTLWRLALVAVAVTLGGCTQIFDAMVNSTNPHSLSASRGEGTRITLSWSAPNPPAGDTTTVTSYTIERDGAEVATTSSTSWSEDILVGGYGVKHSYRVRATLSNGFSSGWTNTDIGWSIDGPKLPLGSAPGLYQTTTSTGWFKTYAAKNWTYHFQSLSGPTTFQVVNKDSADALVPPSTGELVWISDRSSVVWIHTGIGVTATAWYE